MPTLWIVCPCFFDVQSFQKLKSDVIEVLTPFSANWKLMFFLIDDSSGTDSEIKGLKTGANLEVLQTPYTLGHQGALVYGLRKLGTRIAEQDFIVTMDADGEDRPIDLPVLLKSLCDHPNHLSKIALAKRTFRKESRPFKIAYFLFKLAFRTLTGTVILNGNFAAYRGWFLKEIINHPHFDQCYSSSFISLPLQIEFVPLPRGTRFFGHSHMGYFKLVTHGLRMLMPFTEQIAVRGLIASSILIMISVSSSLVLLRISRTAALGSFCLAISLILFSVLCVLLFATFSQSKAGSLRLLRDPK